MLKRRAEARKILGAASIAFVTYLAPAAWATTVYVDGSGLIWPSAYRAIQQGIDAASDGDVVLVAEGTYVENIQFKGKNIILTSTDPIDPAVVAGTIIDGNQAGSVVTFAGSENETCVLSGFTILNGNAEYGGGIRGGIWGDLTQATIQNNRITSNSASYGGGLSQCEGTIHNNTITDNLAGSYGGGLFGCDGTIQNNTITANSAGAGGGLNNCDGTIQYNTITANSARSGGGLSACDGVIQHNTIMNNSAPDYGGGLYYCAATIQNNTITANSAGIGGGLNKCDGIIRNNTIAGNSAGSKGGGVYYCGGTIQNCILWGNIAPINPQLDYQSSLPTYSCIEGWTGGGEGNISGDPQFVDRDGPDNDPQTYEDNDYRLKAISPCVDTGRNQSWMWGALDLDGNNRIFFGGKSKTVDMGAYEYDSFRFTIVEVERMSGNGLTLTWTSRPGDTYDVFVTYRLSGMGWALDSRVPSQGELTTWSSGSMPSSSAFFKVALQ